MIRAVSYGDLAASDLIVDAIYEASSDGLLAGEPISKLLPGSGNMGGFRSAGRGVNKNWVVLFSTGENPDWPDFIDMNTGQLVYYGDNRTPGHELHNASASGNLVLKHAFNQLHSLENPRANVFPFFVFEKHPTPSGSRSVQFKGLAAPGYPGLSSTEDLVAVWKSAKGNRFQNYRAVFTILDVPIVTRAWIADLVEGNPFSENAPAAWVAWAKQGKYLPLTAQPTTEIRSVEEQSPDTALKEEILRAVWEHFAQRPIEFEAFAARIYQMTDQRVIVDQITRASSDGGRDAIGRYLLGLPGDPVYAEFSLEAKCYRPALGGANPNSVGVKEVSRLISRIRHRQFGVLVTTSVVAKQAYQEVREDRHPVVFISGKDIAEILIKNGFNTRQAVLAMLGEVNTNDPHR